MGDTFTLSNTVCTVLTQSELSCSHIQHRPQLRRPCSADMGLGSGWSSPHHMWICNERAILRVSSVWRALLLVIHASWKTWTFCQLDCRLDKPPWSGTPSEKRASFMQSAQMITGVHAISATWSRHCCIGIRNNVSIVSPAQYIQQH